VCRGQHTATRRRLFWHELLRLCHLAAERHEARDSILAKWRHFFFPHHGLLEERRKLLLLSPGSRFLAIVEFGQHLARKQFQRLTDMVVPVLTALLDKRHLINACIFEAL
jgi:hypothetical protein